MRVTMARARACRTIAGTLSTSDVVIAASL
jgi:hypothetical protein